MSLRFAYLQQSRPQPVVSLGGLYRRPRPIIAVSALGPARAWLLNALIDTGSDDTVFPERVARLIGIDLTQAPTGRLTGLGTGIALLRFAQVRLRIADNHERREWQAWVGFTAATLKYPTLGFAGFLQYFTAAFFGDREVVELTVNGQYPGT